MDPSFPKAILHVDGDSFFVSCELTRRPELRGKPVVTGLERGIATAANPEAKGRGVTRGMRVRDIRRLYPDVTILPSDYDMYADFAGRMYAIVRNYADDVEEYSIDECFADLTGLIRPLHMDYETLARTIQADLHRTLGITFSTGLGVNKVTAKIASKWKKPAGFTVIRREDIPRFLGELAIGRVWGIGPSSATHLRRLGITTALDLARKDCAWVAENCDRPLAEIYEEFQGKFVKPVVGGPEQYDFSSVQRTRTFWPATGDKAFLWSQLSYHAEDACMRLRSHGVLAGRVSFFLKTSDFQYLRDEVALADPVSAPWEVLRAIEPVFNELYRGDLKYRATGISLSGLRAEDAGTIPLFDAPKRVKASHAIHKAIDRLTSRFGRHAVFLGSSFKAMKADGEGVFKRKKVEKRRATF